MYYVCDYTTHKAMYGPWKSSFTAARFITDKPKDEQSKYCVMSWYLLCKERTYTNNLAGEVALNKDLASTQAHP